jgi:hypothetical protein
MLFALALIMTTTPNAADCTAAIKATHDQEAVKRVVWDMAAHADGRDWKAERALFVDMVDVDYTSVAGGKPGPVKADDLMAGWTKGLGSYKQTKHNFSEPTATITGDTATATFTGQATHLKNDGNRWSCGGDYSFKLAKADGIWRLTAIKFNMTWEQGTR